MKTSQFLLLVSILCLSAFVSKGQFATQPISGESLNIGNGNTVVAGNRTIAHGELSSSAGKRSIAMGYKVKSMADDSFTVGTGLPQSYLSNNTSGSFLFGYKGVPVMFGKVESINNSVEPLVVGGPGDIYDFGNYAPRIGIGTINPTSALHVVGLLKIRESDLNDNISDLKLLDVKGTADIHKLNITNTNGISLNVPGRANITTLNSNAITSTTLNGTSLNVSGITSTNNMKITSLASTETKFIGVNQEGQVVPLPTPNDNMGNHIATQNIRTNGFWICNSGSNNYGIFMTTNNSVGIGTNTTGSYKLAVNGAMTVNGLIKAKEILVEIGSWPDYVFDAGYRLRDLNEVETFINENGHLPEVPSAKQITEEGLSIGEMNHILLKKVEELTLYIIGLEKRLSEIENKRGGE